MLDIVQMLAFNNYFEGEWKKEWDDLATADKDIFPEKANKLLEAVESLKTACRNYIPPTICRP